MYLSWWHTPQSILPLHGHPGMDWSSSPLAPDDILAGGLLVVFGAVFLPLYTLVAYVMWMHDTEIVGFRFLVSASLPDILLLFNYSIWPGLTILFKSEIIPFAARHWLQFYMDCCWFAMIFHYVLVAASRLAAIRFPHVFRVQRRRDSYTAAAGCYVLAFILVLLTHFQPWHVVFYYEPAAYGMLAEDFDKYMSEGQSLFFFIVHLLAMTTAFALYGWAFLLLLRHRRLNGKHSRPFAPQSSTSANIENRLLIPCVCNSIVFIFGQIVITIGTGEGKWATWMVLVLFSCNSAVNPVLLLIFSPNIRRRCLELLSPSHVVKYTTVPMPKNTMVKVSREEDGGVEVELEKEGEEEEDEADSRRAMLRPDSHV